MKSQRALALGMRRVRKRLGLTQAELAEAADLHEQFVSQLERGARSATLETIDAVAGALGVTPWELLRAGTDEQPPASSARRVQQLVEAWPERDQDRLVRLLVELRGLATSAAPARRRKRKKPI
jgi:transcriptional regulator with XRE-family HTH domain